MIHSIAVCGAGTMGAGIAQVAASGGYKTVLFDIRPEGLERAQAQITKSLTTAVEKGRLKAEDKDAILERLTFTSDIHLCVADVIIEAIVEDMAAKTALFSQLAPINREDAIFVSNTSSLSVSQLAATLPHPQRVAGMHFFNPAHLMKLVEVVSGEQTSPEVAGRVYELARAMGKVPVRVKDAPGFIVNRVARHYYLEAMLLAEQRMADFSTIDQLLENAGFRMGPFALMDLIGNDINLAVTQSLYDAFQQAPRFRPNALQEQRVKDGRLGRKTGLGFYRYEQ
ncbi:3-hydroxybutyryl-CoA dehydrogenase [Chitinophaga oryzae]|uniref:3-hydroxybutyryl-CoA dehydrogenase n=1 Tax=Chitinophaga oryzae TaxID=2725414 RepID=A0AAE7DAN5_9BACT|nr:3-hydroxyacyl-CoA dehydrogenase NAD-binding domain-containing protein [Chitinophaga oryzae]QJB34489.1 3-hydroxybutyryl-CoA dehydrogenase [Chitinophaga oryzae]QJB41007.1 3-hydroxybutyryl-CoA dehydrogenase [Chitinophaga oryzae]